MKTLLRNLILLSCILLLGEMKANAAASKLTVTSITPITSSTILQGTNGVTIYGMRVVANNYTTGTSNVTGLTFSALNGQTISSYFNLANIQLYYGASNTLTGGTLLTAATASFPTATTLSFTGFTQAIGAGNTGYFYIVVNYNNTIGATPTTFELDGSTAGITTSAGSITNNGLAGTAYTLQSYAITITSLTATPGNNGTSGSPVPPGSQNYAVAGYSVVGTGASGTGTITSMTFNENGASFQNDNTYFTTAYVYQSSSATFLPSSPGTLLGSAPADAGFNLTVPFTMNTLNVAYNTVNTYIYLVFSNTLGNTNTNISENATATAGTAPVTISNGQGPTYTFTAIPTITAADITTGLLPVSGSTIYQGQSNLALAGISLRTSASSTPLSQLVFSTGPASSFGNYFGTPQLYSSTSATFSTGTASPVATAVPTVGTSTITFNIPTTPTPVNIGTTATYYYLVLNYSGAGAVPQTVTFSPTSYTTGFSGATVAYANNTYNCSSPVLFSSANTATGMTTGTITGNQAAQSIFGFSLASNTVSNTFTSFNFSATQSIGTYFSNFKLYKNTTANATTATQVTTATDPGLSITLPTTTTLLISGLNQTINNTTYYYFLVADYTAPATSTSFQMTLLTGTTGTTTYSTSANGLPIVGNALTLNPPPPVTVSATSLNTAVNPTQPTASVNLTPNPISANGLGLPIYGLQLVPSATGVSTTITALNFTSVATPTQVNSYFISAAYLYSSTSPSYSAGTATLISTLNAPTDLSTNSLNFPVNIPVSAGGPTTYYYVLIDYTTSIAPAETYQLNFTSATGPVSSGTPIGYKYNFPAPTFAIATNTSGINTTNPYYFGSTGDVLESFGVTSTASANFNTFTLKTYIGGTTGTGAAFSYTNYFNNLTVYSSTNPNYSADLAGTGAALTSVPFTTTGNGTLVVTLTTPQAISTVPIYFFVVGDFTTGDNLFTTASPSTTFQFSMSAATASSTGGTAITSTTTPPIAYTTFTLKAPLVLGAASTAGLAGTTSLNTNLLQQGIFGFSVNNNTSGATAVTETVTGMNFTAAMSPSSYIGNFFSNVTLYVNTSNSITGASLVPAGYTIGSLSGTSLTITNLTQSITSGQTLYYFIKADYTPPSANYSTTFTLTANSVVTTTPAATHTAGAPVTGQTYTCYPSTYLAIASTVGLAANPIIGSQNGIGIAGFSIYSGAANTFTTINLYSTQPIGNIGTYFSNFKLYVNTTGTTFSGATQVTGVTFSTTASTTLTITGLSQSLSNATAYYFIVADYAAPSVATTFQLSCASIATSTTTYSTGGPINGTNYTLTGTLGVYYWTGSGNLNWEDPNNWLNAYTGNSSGYPGQTLNTDIAIFTRTYSTYALANITASHTIGQLIVTANNRYLHNFTALTGVTLTIANGITLSDASTTNPVYGSFTFTSTGTGKYVIGGTSSLYNAGQMLVAGSVTFSANSTVNIYGNTTYQGGIYQSSGTITANNGCTFGLIGSTAVISTTAGQINASSSTFNIPGFGAFLFASGGAFTLTGCTVNVTGISNSSNLTGIGINANGSFTAQTASVINLGTTSINGSYTDVQNQAGTFNLLGSSVINCIGNNTHVYNEYYASGVGGTFNITSSTINLGSANGTDGANSYIYNVDRGLFLLNAGAVINMYGENASFYNTNATNKAGNTYYGVVYCAPTSVINPTSTTAYIGNYGSSNCFTLLSDNTGASATIGQLGNGALMDGVYDVQRYTTGTYRNYRLYSSPVNKKQASSTSGNNIDISYLGANSTLYATLTGNPYTAAIGAFIAGPGTGFGTAPLHTAPNPIIYLYQEKITPGTTYNQAFTSGKNVGIQSINTSYPYNVTTISTAAGGTSNSGVYIPAGNGYLLYYIGSSSRTNTSNTIAPTSSTITASGYVNQGDVPLYIWGTSPTTTLTFTTGALARYPGLTMVGNPYASTIDLQKVYNENNVSLSGTFYELSAATQQFPTYNALTGISSTSEGSEYVASGQGFYIQLNSAGTLTFKEDQKTSTSSGPIFPTPSLLSVGNTPVKTVNSISNLTKTIDAVASVTTDPTVEQPTNNGLGAKSGKTIDTKTFSSLNPVVANGGQITVSVPRLSVSIPEKLSIPVATSAVIRGTSKITDAIVTPSTVLLTGLHLKLIQDSVTYDECGIFFNTAWTDKFEKYDSKDLDGLNPKVYMSSFTSDNVRSSINALGDYSKGKRVPLYVKAIADGNYTLQLEDINNISKKYNVFLVDNLNKDSIDIVKYKTYNFNMSVADTASFSSRFVLAIEHAPVPQYQLISFSGQKVQTGVQLNWKTQNESDYTGFGLQKLVGNSYVTLDSLQSDSLASYNYIDQHPTLGNNIYRLAQNDINGKVTYSTPITIGYNTTPGITGGLTIYPNPSKSIINVTLGSSTANGNYTSDIYNTSGTLIGHRDVTTNSWTEDISSYKLGVYIIELKNSNGILVGKGKFVKIN